jgi:hypothetical protein
MPFLNAVGKTLEVATKNLICFLLALPLGAFGQTALTTAQIAKRVSPSVVVIEGKTDAGDVLGSGFLVSKDGKIVTNLHVIRDMQAATVELANGKVFHSFSILARDEHRDLAIIQVTGADLPVLEVGDSDTLVVGEPVVVVGSPRGLEGTITAGILSSVRDGGEGYKVLQTDAAVNPGNSGGPLLNNKGQAIGVVSFILRSSQGLNFAVPINYVRNLLVTLHVPLTVAKPSRGPNAVAEHNDEQRASTKPAQMDPDTFMQQQKASLKDTLDWLKRRIPLGITTVQMTSKGDSWSTEDQSTVWSADSCTVEVGVINHMFVNAAKSTGERVFLPIETTNRYTVPLGLIIKGAVLQHENAKDPDFVSGDRWTYTLSLSTQYKEIQRAISGNTPSIAPDRVISVDELTLSFDDETIAERVKSAFLHASDLCRKKDKEPF